MSPARTDHDARRHDVSEAVWRVLAEHGFAGLTLRAVAAAMGASTGLVTHYFGGKHELIAHALDILETRTRQRPRLEAPAIGLPALRTHLLDILPLTPEGVAMNRIWVGSWDVALSDPALFAAQATRYERIRAVLRVAIEDAQRLGELPGRADARRLATTALSFTHGLVVQALFAPERFTPEHQTELVDDFLAGLAADADQST
ncbi:TetR/AcrR family transcriptional regulator [Streptosporangium roseum]|uniref:Transcriptional regulator, TetR family n=1 Tax=Streptosporangium roseum (strain ATCC 12428 / DSM 43021 / JCM 3005 / KCTC 9067 / NCIMB 10171 / NRRL 2505 / NI 9100) TaxID=479432 RepID=D2ASU4_STRRD|nr:TetR/AcrR family transcriptional regulator [Streptosporangium roseum]ACZ90421.1 putative transcriptional regulator, TetR family [Streptosporangium roseum DSM 43021]